MLGQLKRNDTNFVLDYAITEADGSVVNLTGATVTFIMGKKNTLITRARATVVSSSAGTVQYRFTGQDTLLAGNFLGEFLVEFSDGTMKTYPSNSYISINIQANLDAGQSNVIVDSIAAKQGDFEAKLNDILKRTGDGNPEIVVARGNYSTLAARLNDMVIAGKFQVGVMDKNYGAVGNGTKDDTAAIQKALDVAKLNVLAYGIEVRIPPGIFRLTSRLTLWKNTTITMDKNTTLLRDHSAGWFINGVTGDNFTGYNGNGNIIIQGGILEGNINKWNNSYNAIGLARGRGLVFKDMEIRDVRGAHAFDINACKDVIIERCRFLGYDPNINDGDNASNFREAIQISNHTAAGFTGFGSWDGLGCENVTVRDCYFGASANRPAWCTGVGNHGHVAGIFTSKIYVYNNIFDGCSWAGIRPYKFNDMKIHHNHFVNCSYGVRFSNYDGLGETGGNPEAAKNLEITDNTFVNTTVRDIYIAAWQKGGYVSRHRNIKILDNTSEGATSTQTIYLSFCDDVQVRGNIVDGAYRFVWVEYSTNVHIFGNDVDNVVNEGVYVVEPDATLQNLGYTSKIFISHNEFQNIGRTPLLVSCAVDEFEVNFNYLKNVATEAGAVGTRSAITVANSAKNGRVMNNKIRGTTHKYGVEITSSCSNVQSFNNDSTGAAVKPQVNNSVGGFEGYYMHSPNGNRYKVTIGDTGTITATIG